METAASSTLTLSERADALEQQLSDELDRAIPVRAQLYTSGERDPRLPPEVKSDAPEFAGKKFNMGHDYRLPKTATAALHLVGDGVAVAVVRHLAEQLLEPLLATPRMLAAE